MTTGDFVKKDEILLEIKYNDINKLKEALPLLIDAYKVEASYIERPTLIKNIIK